MEKRRLKELPGLDDVASCLEENEEVFAIFENTSSNGYAIIAWGSLGTIRGNDEDTLLELKTSVRRLREYGQEDGIDVNLVGYMSYDSVRLWERIPDLRPQPERWFYLEFFQPASVILYDYASGHVYVKGDPSLIDKCRERRRYTQRIEVRFYDASLEGRRFEEAVEEALRYISEGYVFQVVLSRFLRYTYIGGISSFYSNLRKLNPSPYRYYLRFGERAIVGASPELLFAYTRGVVETFPIAGTRPRGRTLSEDLALEKELLESEKDRAEHVMLVDLARDNLGRVCAPGTVRVERLMQVEKYSYIQHLVSKVVGVVKRKHDAVDLLKALMPAGTVSGAPKPFAMRLIEELEEYKRGPYAGALGFFTSSGDSLMVIAIRSAFINKDILRIQAGAGVVYDSNPRMELEETEHKLSVLKQALGVERGGS